MTGWRSRTRAAAFALCAGLLLLTVVPKGSSASGAVPPTTRLARLSARVPRGSTHLGQVPGSQPFTFEIVLAPTHRPEMEALIAAQRDPHSSQFGHYLAPGEFVRRFGPSSATIATTTNWLHAQGLRDVSVADFTVTAHATADAGSRALGVSLERYRTADRREAYIAAGAPLVPASIAGDVAALVGLSSAVVARPLLDTSPRALPASAARDPNAIPHDDGLTPCAAATTKAGTTYHTPDHVGALYGVGDLLAAGQNGTGQRIALLELAPHSNNVNTYKTCFGLTNPITTTKVDGGGSSDANGTLEANIDIEEAMTQAPGAAITSYEGPNTDQGEYDVFHRIVTDDNATAVSTSWGICEAFATGGQSSMSGLDVLFAQAAAQGQTVTAASGDSGSEDCYRTPLSSTALAVDSPADDPFVTGVGGTSLVGAGNEPVWNDCQGEPSYAQCLADLNGANAGAEGGGKSGSFPLPSWQPALGGGSCTVTGGCRQVPDVAANAGVGEIFYSSAQGTPATWLAVGGTSIASPKIAAIVADINTACAVPVGDLAPRLLALSQSDASGGYGTAFNDMTTGDNDLLRNHGGLFPAASGYDVATGVGSPIAGGWSCAQVDSLDVDFGNPGDTVTITGLGLADATFTFGGVAASVVSQSPTSATVTVPNGSGTVTVQATNAMGAGTATALYAYGSSPPTTTTTTTTTTTATTTTTTAPPTTTTTTAPKPPPHKTTVNNAYRTVASDGGIFDFGGSPFYGSTGNIHLNQPIVGMTDDNATKGYWFVARDGGIFGFHAPFYGSSADIGVASPVVGMAATPSGSGYWVATSDGHVFGFGGAQNYGSVRNLHAPIAGIASTNDGKGYWLAGTDGSVYAFGDAPDYGSMFGTALTRPVVGITIDVATGGYWLVASDGGIFGFHAPFYGSTGAIKLNQPIVGIAATVDGKGYWMVARDGGIFAFGAARFSGSMGGSPLNKPMVGIAATR